MKFFIKQISAFITILLLTSHHLQSAVIKGTMIATVGGLVRVEQLCVGKQVLGFDTVSKTTTQTPVIAFSERMIKSVVLIFTDQDVIIAAADQQLYDPVANNWITSATLTTGNHLMNSKGNHIKCCAVTMCTADEEIFTVYDITVKEPHNFYATEAQVLTHNVFPVIGLGLGFAFGETLASVSLTGVFAAIGAFLFGVGAGGVAISLANSDSDICFKNPLDDEHKQRHILQDKHNWSNLVPDPKNNWDKVVKIIATVMAEGTHGPYKESKEVMIATAEIGGRIVQVTYRVIGHIISDAWVK